MQALCFSCPGAILASSKVFNMCYVIDHLQMLHNCKNWYSLGSQLIAVTYKEVCCVKSLHYLWACKKPNSSFFLGVSNSFSFFPLLVFFSVFWRWKGRFSRYAQNGQFDYILQNWVKELLRVRLQRSKIA